MIVTASMLDTEFAYLIPLTMRITINDINVAGS